MMKIGAPMMYSALKEMLHKAFTMPEIQSAVIKGYRLHPISSEEEIQKAFSAGYHDVLSDMDIVFQVVPSDTSRLLSELGITRNRWLGCMCNNGLYRVILKDGLRYDLSFQREDGTLETGEAPDALDAFWFIQVQALAKLYRGDYLIADHLANMNINETLVQQMVLRDRKYGMNFHRYGYNEDLRYQSVESCPYANTDRVFSHIANKLYAAAVVYDQLGTELDSAHEKRCKEFLELWEAYQDGYAISTGGKG